MSEEEKTGACHILKDQLFICLARSDCMRKDGNTLRECLKKTTTGVDEECRAMQISFFECRRSMLDMRTRFRGRKGD